ncbi:MAG: beta-ketoacyl-[acyl-carrier-protein] synthase family protein [Enterobacteriaceae bacterium]
MIYISAIGMVNALGNSLSDIVHNLQQGTAPGMQPRQGWLQNGVTAMLGAVEGELPPIPYALRQHNSRNNQLLLAALQQIRPQVDQAIQRFGSQRVALVLGTSTSGLDECDRFVDASLNGRQDEGYHYFQQEMGDPSRFLAAFLQLSGPAFTLSTACTSSARAVISGRRLLQAGLADAVIVGGADTLSRMPINGFNSLEALSLSLCRPFSQARCGITIGEGAGLMLLTREPAEIALLGIGESSDAWHISAPHPQGEGAIRAIEQALQDAGLSPQEIGYINLHGTATTLNDQIEAAVIHLLFAGQVPCSSTKPLTGHTLGAAGITEAALCALILLHDLPLPAQNFSDTVQDATLPPFGLLRAPAPLGQPVIMSNSFAFGGNNTSLIIGRSL